MLKLKESEDMKMETPETSLSKVSTIQAIYRMGFAICDKYFLPKNIAMM